MWLHLDLKPLRHISLVISAERRIGGIRANPWPCCRVACVLRIGGRLASCTWQWQLYPSLLTCWKRGAWRSFALPHGHTAHKLVASLLHVKTAITCSFSFVFSGTSVLILSARLSRVRATATLWASGWCDSKLRYRSVWVSLEHCCWEGSIALMGYWCIQEWQCPFRFLFDGELNGRLNWV